jgi:hypothetical protein
MKPCHDGRHGRTCRQIPVGVSADACNIDQGLVRVVQLVLRGGKCGGGCKSEVGGVRVVGPVTDEVRVEEVYAAVEGRGLIGGRRPFVSVRGAWQVAYETANELMFDAPMYLTR